MAERSRLFAPNIYTQIYLTKKIPFVKPFFDLSRLTFYSLSDVRNNRQSVMRKPAGPEKGIRKSVDESCRDAQKELLRRLHNRKRKSKKRHLLPGDPEGGL